MTEPQHLTIAQASDIAQREVTQGNISKALQLYQVVLQHQPHHVEAKEGLRKLQEKLPDNQAVKGPSVSCSQDELNALIGLFKSGQMIKVEQRCKELLQPYPQSIVVLNILGLALQAQGKLKEAVQEYNKAIQLKPDYVDAYNNHGNALHKQGKLEEALQSYNKALQLKPDYVIGYNNRANIYKAQGKLEKAINSFDKAIELNANNVEAHYNRGITLHEHGRLEEAVKSYDRALQLKPDLAVAHYNRGNALRAQGKLEKAVKSYDKALQLKPNYLDVYNNRGLALQRLQRWDESMASYEQAIKLDPNFVATLNNIARLYAFKGQINQAVKTYKKVIRLNNNYVEAHYNLSKITKYDKYDDSIRAMESLYVRKDISSKHRIQLAFALGKAFEDLKEHNKSFEYILEGNELKRETYHYKIESDMERFNKIKEVFSSAFFSSHIKTGNPDEAPIFILGMPRSGTTLVEQILASHTQVYGAGELGILREIYFECQRDSKCILDLSEEAFEVLGASYIEKLRKHSNSKKFITDKMPQNFWFIGFIKVILPKAKIIHCMRDPRDNCFSIFKTVFSKEHNYAYNLRELGQYYNLYLDLMNHWRETIPDFIYDISYEALVLNQEEVTRKLLTYCELPWQKSCLLFHKTNRPIATASYTQVRRPMYSDSVNLWEKYESQLKPLKEVLGH